MRHQMIQLRLKKTRMYIYQYLLFAGFLLLLTSNMTRDAALIFLVGWVVYLVVTIGASNSVYFVASGTIETAIAFYLNKRYRLVSYLGYSLLLVNVFGYFLYVNGISRGLYDLVYAIISVTQFLFLLARAIPNGLNRLHRKHFVVRAINFDSRGAYDRMCKNTQEKSSYR